MKRFGIITAASLALTVLISAAVLVGQDDTADTKGKAVTDKGWQELLKPDLSTCIFPAGSWIVEDGVLTWQGGGYIWTKERYGNFILDLEYRVSKDANSGIFLRTGDLDDPVQTGIEVQIHETGDGSRHGQCGAIYDCLSPRIDSQKKAGEWNRLTITCRDSKISVVQNGKQIIDMDLDLWTTPHLNPDGSRNKFKTAMKDMPREGHIGFQDHGRPVWFRALRIKEL